MTNGTMSQFWTPSREAKLRQMFEDRKSYTEMVAALGCSRGAVAGKLTRLHLTNKNAGRPDRRKGNRNNPMGRKGKLGNLNRRLVVKIKAIRPHQPPSLQHVPPRQHAMSEGRIWQPSNGGEGVGFDELAQGACAWPVAAPSRRWPPQWRHGVSGMVCCGAKVEPERPYCAMHAKVSVGEYEQEAAHT